MMESGLGNTKNTDKMLAAIEAVLFVYGEPMEIKRISKILKSDPKFIKDALEQINQQHQNENRGLKMIFSPSPTGEKVQLATKPEFSALIENIVKEKIKEQLTPASLETLALVSYLGPLSRNQIDFYRGVNSSFILRALLIRGLIERFPDPKKVNMYLYQPSFDLLKYLGISKVEELPEYSKYKSEIRNSKFETDLPQAGHPEGAHSLRSVRVPRPKELKGTY